MTERLFLQCRENTQQSLDWYHLEDDQLISKGEITKESLVSLKEQYPDIKVTLVIPSTDCLMTRVAMPAKQRRQQLKAIPFVLEDLLAEDIDEMHFAIGKRDETGHLPVIAISKTKMNAWTNLLKNSGFEATAILPACALLEAPSDAWSIFKINENYLINQSGTAWSAGEDEAAMMLQLSVNKISEDELPGLIYWGEEELPGWVAGLGLEISHQVVKEPQLALLNRYSTSQVNLLQGEFENQDNWQSIWQVWRKVAMIAGLALVAKFTHMGVELYQLKDEQQHLKTEINATYHQVAPGARIVNAERQMRQLLSQYQGNQNQSATFLGMIAVLGEGLNSIKGIQPTNLNYNSTRGEIRLDLLVNNLPLLDQLKNYLTSKGLNIEVGGASAQGSQYNGRMIIRSAS